MRRELQRLLAVVVVAIPVALVSSPGVARAGISTELKTPARPADYYEAQNQFFLHVMAISKGNSGGSSSTTDEVAPGSPKKPGRGPHNPGDPVMLFGETEWRQIEQGLITEEEAISGCGGAQVAGGNASFGALALAGLFLALRRRRR